MLKYTFHSYIKIPVSKLISNGDGTSCYLGMSSLEQIYELSYSNQRTNFYDFKELELRNFDTNQNIFSIEGSEGLLDEKSNLGFQRKESTRRLKSIAEYLSSDSNFFPNNVILSANNERWYNDIASLLFIDKERNGDSLNFYDYLSSNKIGNDGYILFSDFEIELCRVVEDSSSGNYLYIPKFLLNEGQDDSISSLFEEGGPFYGLKGEEKEIKLGELQVYKTFWIIDGQHRIFSCRYLNNTDNNSIRARKQNIPFTCFLNTPINKQAEIFITVNNTSKRVDTSLIYDLLPITPNEQSAELAAKVLFDAFKTKGESPLKKILYALKGEDNTTQILSQSHFVNELKFYFRPGGIFGGLMETKDLTPAYKLLYLFFHQVNIVYSEAFDSNGDYIDSNYGIYRTTGFGALIQLFITLLLDYQIRDKNFDLCILISDEHSISSYFAEKLTNIKIVFDFSRTRISKFRGRGGQVDLANLFKYILKLTDDLEQSDIDKIEDYLDKKYVRIFDDSELYNLNYRLRKAIENSQLEGKTKISFREIILLVTDSDIGKQVKFNTIITKIISELKRGDYYILSKGKTPYNTISTVITRDLREQFEKLGNYTFIRNK